jgi:hypothetical protein
VTRESDHGYTTERWDLQGAPGHPRHRLLLGTAVARRPLATGNLLPRTRVTAALPFKKPMLSTNDRRQTSNVKTSTVFDLRYLRAAVARCPQDATSTQVLHYAKNRFKNKG